MRCTILPYEYLSTDVLRWFVQLVGPSAGDKKRVAVSVCIASSRIKELPFTCVAGRRSGASYRISEAQHGAHWNQTTVPNAPNSLPLDITRMFLFRFFC